MAWPSLSDYNAALLKAPATFVPPSLSDCKVVPGPMGLPMPVSGGYAFIYELRDGDGSRKALRCFREDDPGRRARAAAVCQGLARVRASRPDLAAHFIRAVWEEKCLSTSAGTVPAMVMDWAEGVTLGARLEALQDDPGGLRDLRERIHRMLALLAAEGIVHGDLQTGNILVGPDGIPVLIDYDGLILPGLPSGSASPDQHPNFQHPEWDGSCDPALKDRFPSIVLDLGLAAMAEDLGLFPRFSTGENVLFRAEDLAEPDASPVFAALRTIPALSRAAELLAGLSLGPVSGLPTLDEFRGEAWKARPGAAASPRAAAPEAAPEAASPAAYRGAYPVYDATDYFGLLAAVGEKVEVVGRVVGVKRAFTKYGKPYAFVNFGNWREDGFKLTVWSEGLATFRKPPTDSWQGRWVTATGLMDEPYENERFGTTQLSVTVQDASQVRFLDEAEALRRLGKSTSGRTSSGRASGTASGTWTAPGAGARPSAGPGGPAMGTAARTATGGKPSNEELLARLRSGSSGPAASRPAASPSSYRPATPPSPSSGPPASSGGSGGCLVYILIGIGVAIFTFLRNLM